MKGDLNLYKKDEDDAEYNSGVFDKNKANLKCEFYEKFFKCAQMS